MNWIEEVRTWAFGIYMNGGPSNKGETLITTIANMTYPKQN